MARLCLSWFDRRGCPNALLRDDADAHSVPSESRYQGNLCTGRAAQPDSAHAEADRVYRSRERWWLARGLAVLSPGEIAGGLHEVQDGEAQKHCAEVSAYLVDIERRTP